MQKFISKISLVSFILALALSFISPERAYAACNYTNAISSNKYTISKSDTALVSVKVTRSGELSDCTKDNEFRVLLYFKTSSNPRALFGSQDLRYGNDSLTADFVIDPNKLDPAMYATLGSLQIKTEVWSIRANPNGGVMSGDKLTESGFITINVTGTSSSSGSLTSQVYFKPDRASFAKDEPVQILLHLTDKSQVDKLDPSIQKLFMVAKVNGHIVGIREDKPRDDFKLDQGTDTKVTIANGFKDGANSIVVELWSAGTNLKVSGATANLQTTGLGGSTNPGPGPDGNPTPGPDDGTNPNPGPDDSDGGLSGVETINAPIAIGSLGELIIRIINYLITLIGALTVLMIIYGGFRMVMSGGSETALAAGKKTVTWAVLGLVVTLLAFTIVNVVQSLLNKK